MELIWKNILPSLENKVLLIDKVLIRNFGPRLIISMMIIMKELTFLNLIGKTHFLNNMENLIKKLFIKLETFWNNGLSSSMIHKLKNKQLLKHDILNILMMLSNLKLSWMKFQLVRRNKEKTLQLTGRYLMILKWITLFTPIQMA